MYAVVVVAVVGRRRVVVAWSWSRIVEVFVGKEVKAERLVVAVAVVDRLTDRTTWKEMKWWRKA